MTAPLLAPAFRQIAWVVKDIAAAEEFFVGTMAIKKFLHMDTSRRRTPRGPTGSVRSASFNGASP